MIGGATSAQSKTPNACRPVCRPQKHLMRVLPTAAAVADCPPRQRSRTAHRGSGRGLPTAAAVADCPPRQRLAMRKAADSVEPTALGKSDDYCFFFSIIVLVVTIATITTAKRTIAMHQSIQ